MRELRTEVLIVGGGTGGVAAALAVARAGRKCVMTEPTPWIGGQLTSQAVPPDENRWIEGKPPHEGFHGATRSYIDYRNRVRQWYREHRNLTDEARNNPYLNPGGGWVSHVCHEPVVGHAVLQEMLAPHLTAGRVQILLGHEPVSASVDGGRVRSVVLRGPEGEVEVSADYILDATELGDVLPLTKTQYRLGSESKSELDEHHAPDEGRVDDIQAITWCFAVENRPGEDHRISKPDGYEAWRDWVPPLTPPWPGPLFSWQIDYADDPRTLNIVPWPDKPDPAKLELWLYRRIVDRSIYAGDNAPPDVALWNTVQTDYFRDPVLRPDASCISSGAPSPNATTPHADGFQSVGQRAKHQARCFLYWMQTDAPRHDDGHGYPGLRLRGQELGTEDGFAMAPYIRECRRLVGRTFVTEHHIGLQQRQVAGLTDTSRSDLGIGETFADSVGIGHYMIDLHPSAAMRNTIFVAATPFRIPLGALLPAEGAGPANLIVAGKALSVSHIANGCYRLHPIEWNIGEAAGALAAHCVEQGVEPEAVHADKSALRAFQQRLIRDGFELSWPWEDGANL